MMALGPAGPVWPPLPWKCGRHQHTHHTLVRRDPARWRTSRPVVEPQSSSEDEAPRLGNRQSRRGAKRWRNRRPAPDSSSSEDEAPRVRVDSYHSDTETNMPGGFENSAMKSSFSLSSLQPSSISLELPEHASTERPYHSLRKTCRKDPEKEARRRSWDKKEDSKDEFWDALKPNYLYLMDNNLIDSCKEAGRDLYYGTSPTQEWNFEQFCTQFTELDLWLTSIQDTIYSKEENVTDRNLRLTQVEEMHRKTYKRKVFNNQGGRLVARFPETTQEVKWRMTHLNHKWERLEQTVTPRKRTHPNHLTHASDIQHELDCLRKWIRMTERRLPTISFHTTWTLSELEVKAKEYKVIQQEVESHGKVITSVLQRLERVEAAAEAAGSPVHPPSGRAPRICDLRDRWLHLCLRSLEWVVHIETLTKRAKNKSPVRCYSPEIEDGEPKHKHRRLSSSPWPAAAATASSTHYYDDDDDCLMDDSSSEDMVGSQSEVGLPLAAGFKPASPSASLLGRSGSLEADMLNKNYSYNDSRRQSVPIDTARKLFTETSTFTKSDRPAQNCATFYFKHHDTESEQEEGKMETDSKNMDESSEEEWTYKCGQDSPAQNENDSGSLCQSTETLASVPKSLKQEPSLSRPCLQKLIQKAEEIVQPASPSRKPRVFEPPTFSSARAKSKVKQWMKEWDLVDSKPQDESCDASGETEEESHSSGDFNTSVIHTHLSEEALPCDSPVLDKSSPTHALPNTPDHFKIPPVVLRVKRNQGSIKRPLSESGLPQVPLGEDKLLQSRSESALNQIDHTPTQSVKMDTSIQGTLSSSTTVEEIATSQTQEGSGGGYSTNSLRKRKLKHRKRNSGRKGSGDSGSDKCEPASPVKAGATVAVRRLPVSGTETEEEEEGEAKLRARRKQLAQPMFKLGPDGLVTVFNTSAADKALSAESSFSEQAWDSYQEKYMSEAYSEEIADQETTRRLLEFGDDYRNFLDSQSDGASSLGMGRPPGFHRRRRLAAERTESDSDGGETRNLIVEALKQADIKSNCKDYRVIKMFINDFTEECRESRGLIKRSETADEMQKVRSLQREIASLREELVGLTNRLGSLEHTGLRDRDQLEHKIQQIKGEQVQLRERKSQLIEVNSAVHKFITDRERAQQDITSEAATSLKNDVKDLYFVWEETNKRLSDQLDSLSQLSAAWLAFDSHLSELQVALRGDHNTLRLLDSALKQGPVSQDLTSSVSDVAKVLSEKQDLCYQSESTLSSAPPVILSLPGSTEGSLSDSGISDSGSEQESERERRLSVLRRLARQLAAALSPDHQAVLDMTKRIEQTELELRELQKTCRELIGRTAVSAEAPPTSAPEPTVIHRRKRQSIGSSGPHSLLGLAMADADPEDPEDKGPGGWLWRVIRAALPFQLALLAIFCVVRLLEPSCCDNMNNLNFSLTPQLRYMNGPPPI